MPRKTATNQKSSGYTEMSGRDLCFRMDEKVRECDQVHSGHGHIGGVGGRRSRERGILAKDSGCG